MCVDAVKFETIHGAEVKYKFSFEKHGRRCGAKCLNENGRNGFKTSSLRLLK